VGEPIFFASTTEWHEWLAAHHQTASECVVGFVKVTTGTPNMRWAESVEAALCFGWIDGVRRRIDDTHYSIRFTPRKPKSIWSNVNIAKIDELRAAGRMAPAGEAAFAARSEERSGVYSHERPMAELTEVEAKQLAASKDATAYFEARPISYRRAALNWIVSAKRSETRVRRLEQLIADSTAGRDLKHLRRYQ
jgi:uncharacterized protein YdeI (YjbR/CyaY-like superfamily)